MSGTTNFLRSREMKEMLRKVGGGEMSMWTAKRIYDLSKKTALVGFTATMLMVITMVVIYPPLFLDRYYMSTTFGSIFGVSSTIFFVTVAPVVLAQEFAVLVLMLILTELVHDVFESSFSHLHEQVASVGLHQFVLSRKVSGVQGEALQRFSDSWCHSHIIYMRLQKFINPVLRMHYAINLIGLTVPWFYLIRGRYVNEGNGMSWMALLRPWLWWSFAALVYSATIILPARCSYMLDCLAKTGSCISLGSKDTPFLQTMLRQDLTWSVIPFRMTPMMALALLTPILAGVIGWAIIVEKMISPHFFE